MINEVPAGQSCYRREFDSLEIFDADGFSLPLFVFGEDAQGKQTSQELRLNYDGGGKLTAFAGVSYFHEDGSQRVPLQFNEKVYALHASGVLPKPNGLPLPTINTPCSRKARSCWPSAKCSSGERS